METPTGPFRRYAGVGVKNVSADVRPILSLNYEKPGHSDTIHCAAIQAIAGEHTQRQMQLTPESQNPINTYYATLDKVLSEN